MVPLVPLSILYVMKKKNICSHGSRYLDSLDSLPLTAVVLIVLNREIRLLNWPDGPNGTQWNESLRQIVKQSK